jgi:hypothetical protein
MNRALIAVSILLIIVSSACSSAPESPFYKSFSMREVLTSNKPVGFDCDAAGGGGTGSEGIFSRSGGVGGRIHFHSQKDDAISCRLTSGELTSANEEMLIVSVRRQVENLLRTYGASIKETGSRNARSFYFAYAIKDIQGRIQVSGTRIGGDYYSLQAELEETN